MEELLQGTAKGQQRLEEAERRTRDTAGERAAKRIKLQFADRPADPVSSSSASRNDATAGGDAASASNVVAGGVFQNAGNAVAGDTAMATTAHGEEDRTGDGSVKRGEDQRQATNSGLTTRRMGAGKHQTP